MSKTINKEQTVLKINCKNLDMPSNDSFLGVEMDRPGWSREEASNVAEWQRKKSRKRRNHNKMILTFCKN